MVKNIFVIEFRQYCCNGVEKSIVHPWVHLQVLDEVQFFVVSVCVQHVLVKLDVLMVKRRAREFHKAAFALFEAHIKW